MVPFGTEPLGIFLLLRAFAGGSVALTGVEAIANGVPAFKPPESKNAANTMITMALLLGVLFIGITVVVDAFGIRPTEEGGQTIVAIVAASVFGDGTFLFIAFQAATALILFLAVNTSFNAFPRLAAILAQDGFMPRQFSFRGDRLAFSWGIIVLATIAGSLIVIFQGDTHALIPLYSVGVFVCFTLSQTGMVRHWFSVREPGMVVAGRGQCLRRPPHAGRAARRREREVLRRRVARARPDPGGGGDVLLHPPPVRHGSRPPALRPDQVVAAPHREERVVIPVNGLNRAVVQAVNVGRSMADDVRAVLVADDHEYAEEIQEAWARQVPGVPLVVVESPYRALTGPLLAYLDVLDHAWSPDKETPITFVVIPEFVPRHWWERLLYNQSTNQLRRALLGRPNTVVTNVPYRREEAEAFRRREDPAPPYE